MKIIDLFCGGGGAAMGMHQALAEKGIKHEIHGYDIKDMPDYPFNFYKYDVMDLSFDNVACDFIWASPPCHKWVDGVKNKDDRPDYITPTRTLLKKSNIPYCIENVDNAPLKTTLILVGEIFGLRVWRRRIFETSFVVIQPKIPDKKGTSFHPFRDNRNAYYYTVVNGMKTKGIDTKENWEVAMGINWMTLYDLTQAVPPAYSKYIMQQYLKKWRSIDSWIK